MESAFYGYYSVTTDCLSDTWKTDKIEAFIKDYGGFKQSGAGSFKYKKGFCTLQLMLVKDYNSWSNHDYDPIETNYIDIVTAKILIPNIGQFFRDIEMFLGRQIVEETDDSSL